MELAIEQELVIGKVLDIRDSQPRIGTRKLHGMLHDFMLSHGIKMGRDALFDLLAVHNLLIRRRKKKGPKTTDGTGAPKWPNLLEDMAITKIQQVWATDITYVQREKEGWYYLMALVDLFSHQIVGWHLSERMTASACLKALQMALEAHPQLPKGLIHHSDRGSQYRSDDYLEQLKKHHIKVSMCKKPQENGVSERLNGILKNELLDGRPLPSNLEQARAKVAAAIATYNCNRPHDSLGGLFPQQVHQGKQPLPSLWKKREKRWLKEKKNKELQEY